MALTKIKYGNSGKLALTIRNLSQVGKKFNQITNVVFMLKEQASNTDASAVLRKELATGDIYISDEKFIVKIEVSDFGVGKLEAKRTYLIAIGVEFDSSGELFEDEDDGMQRKLKVVEDKIRG